MSRGISNNSQIACVLVGMPARGKTYISQKVCRYLTWLGIKTKVFNVGNFRRELCGAKQSNTFFDPKNESGQKQRKEAANMALMAMLEWYEKEDGIVGIYDATNSTLERRKWLNDTLSEKGIQAFFIESICEDESVVAANILEVKLNSPDYNGMPADEAVADFQARIAQYESQYQTIVEKDYSFIKLINVGSQVIVNLVKGYLESRIVYYLMNLHIRNRKIYMSRHGESMYNLDGKLGGDSDLSPRGQLYAKILPELIKEKLGDKDLVVWTSTLKRTIQTSEFLPYPKQSRKSLDELDAGVCDGLTYEQVEEKYPEDFARRDDDKFNYRYRGGESYRDVVLRLEPIIMDLERQEDILIVGHQAIIRCLYGYFMNYKQEDLPYIKIPLHTLIELTPKAYFCEEKFYKADIPAVDTHRAKPTEKKKPITQLEIGSGGEIPSPLLSNSINSNDLSSIKSNPSHINI
ncbi:6-phosphofructo-2-kinase-domain-containing protein [Cunninghamella echinulata]|nr:6-phosphofructo-2-kinase-domain-containing protein [Cunninghamella echinulata]